MDLGHGFLVCLLLFFSLSCLATSQEPNTDGYFVSEFFQKMGAELPSSSPNSPVCSWRGVSCDAKKDRVTGFVASGLGFSGPIPEDTIAKLSKLQFLDLSSNSISAFSTDFWELGSSLKSLNLSHNHINGPLPNNIGNFGQLQSLDVSFNGFGGEIPTALGSIAGLALLNLSHNLFQGQIPNAIVDGCKNLASLDLSANAVDGGMPDLSPLVSLTFLNVSGNRLRGSILGAFQEQLQVIDLSNNGFSEVNFSSGYHGSSLVYLDLSVNALGGEFEFGRFRLLKHINLAFNKFSGRNFFDQLGELADLEYLNLSRTGLTGQIPSELSSLLLILRVLDLSQNYITGQVPDLSSMELQVLDLSVNNLTGEIPEPLVKKFPSMERFNFSYNNLTVCASELSREAFSAAFAGSRNDCPIAVNPDHVRNKGGKQKGLKLALVIVLSVFFLVLGLLCLAFACKRRRRRSAMAMPTVKQVSFKDEPSMSGPFAFQTDSTTWVADVKVATSVPIVIFEKPLLSFTFADLLAATSNFDRGTLLAEGRFGPVYRGFLPGGVQVAVKVLVHGSAMADQDAAKELERLGRIKHPNLVPLTGYCLAGDQRIAIFEYMENGNLNNLLYDLPLGVQTTEDWSADTWEDNNGGVENITLEGTTTWRFRHKIALGVARALAFLHHGCIPQIVHRDVKASSIYFDSGMEPRLADFGLSMIAGTSSEDNHSHCSPGYAPPEFSDSENTAATTKSDVYGFGVVLFELITGKKPLGDEYPGEKESSLVTWARAMVKKNSGSNIIDPKIRDTGSEKQTEEALRIAYLCTADLPSKRPAMQQIVGLLKDIEPKVASEQN